MARRRRQARHPDRGAAVGRVDAKDGGAGDPIKGPASHAELARLKHAQPRRETTAAAASSVRRAPRAEFDAQLAASCRRPPTIRRASGRRSPRSRRNPSAPTAPLRRARAVRWHRTAGARSFSAPPGWQDRYTKRAGRRCVDCRWVAWCHNIPALRLHRARAGRAAGRSRHPGSPAPPAPSRNASRRIVSVACRRRETRSRRVPKCRSASRTAPFSPRGRRPERRHAVPEGTRSSRCPSLSSLLRFCQLRHTASTLLPSGSSRNAA